MATEPSRVLRTTFYASVGFGILAFQKVQVRRRELERSVKPQVDAVERHLRSVAGRRPS
jgi:hypothetical protein